MLKSTKKLTIATPLHLTLMEQTEEEVRARGFFVDPCVIVSIDPPQVRASETVPGDFAFQILGVFLLLHGETHITPENGLRDSATLIPLKDSGRRLTADVEAEIGNLLREGMARAYEIRARYFADLAAGNSGVAVPRK